MCTIGRVLGFQPEWLGANTEHYLRENVDILKVNLIMIKHKNISVSYLNSKSMHIIMYFPKLRPDTNRLKGLCLPYVYFYLCE